MPSSLLWGRRWSPSCCTPFSPNPAAVSRLSARSEREILDLEEKKSRLYAALTDLDFEKEAGKVSETDHQAARTDYLSQVAAVLARLDEIAANRTEKKKERKAATCEGCGEKLPPEAKFCMGCGKKVGS